MRKTLILFLIILLAGCSTNTVDKTEQKKPKVENSDTSHNEDENDNGQSDDGDVAVNQDENDDTTEDEQGEEKPSTTYHINPANWTIEPNDKSDQKILLLTIDDAPDQYALEMAQKLKNMKVPAIFFVNGHFIDTDEEKEVLKKIHELGFEIGNHTMTHANLSNLTVKEQNDEIVPLSKEIETITGEAPRFFRAPFGVNTDYSKQLTAKQGMLFMNWTYGYDWVKEYQTSDAIADIMVNTNLLTDGAILLMHDREWTNKALEKIVKGLQAKGYTFADPEQIEK